MMTTAGGEVGG